MSVDRKSKVRSSDLMVINGSRKTYMRANYPILRDFRDGRIYNKSWNAGCLPNITFPTGHL